MGSPLHRPISGDAGRWLTIAAGIGLAWLSISLFRPPRPAPTSAPDAAFSAERAFRHVEVIAAAPHPPGSAANEVVREYLLAQLRALGLEPVVHRFEPVGSRGPRPIGGRLENLLVRVRGTANTRAVMLAAHYDTKPATPGAGDDTAAVGALLETLRALRASPPLRNDLIVLLTDAEEAGMIGAHRFVRDHPWAADVGLVFNFDAAGSAGPSMMYQASAGNGALVAALDRAAPHVIANSIFEFAARHIPNDTDFTEFRNGGMAGMNFAFIGGWQDYHQPSDVPANLDRGSLQHVGDYALALARHFGNEPLPLPPSPDAVFFNPIGAIFIRYPIAWVIPGSVALALLAVLVARRSMARDELRPGELVLGWLAILIPAALAAGIAWLIAPTKRFEPDGYRLEIERLGWVLKAENSGWFPLAGATLAVLAAAIGHHLASRKLQPKVMVAARALGWALVAVVLGFVRPEVSFIVFWPALLDVALLLLPATALPRMRAALAPLLAVLLFSPLLLLLWQIAPFSPFVILPLAAILAFGVLAGTGRGRN